MKVAISIFAITLLYLCGCAEFLARQPKLDYQKIVATGKAHSRRAATKNRVGIELMKEPNFEGAELAFQQALIADSTYGPAHNNLGKLYYEQGDNYLAAREFEEARRLMPGCPQPVNNLGLIYYCVDKFDEAIEYFQQAYQFCPTNPEYLGNLVRARVRRGDRTYDLREQIEALRLIENRPQWKDWEAEQLALGGIDELLSTEEIVNSCPMYQEIQPVPTVEIQPLSARRSLELQPSLESQPLLKLDPPLPALEPAEPVTLPDVRLPIDLPPPSAVPVESILNETSNE